MKQEFFEKYLNPVFQPIFDFFSLFLIAPMTVIGLPGLVFLFLALRSWKEVSNNKVQVVTIVASMIGIGVAVVVMQTSFLLTKLGAH